MKLFRWFGYAASSVALLVGGGLAQQAAVGLSDRALDQAFQAAFGVTSAQAQEISFLTYLGVALDGLPANPSYEQLKAAIAAAIASYVAAGGSELPPLADIIAAFPALEGIAAAYIEAVSEAVDQGIVTPEAAVVALGGDVS